MLTHGTEDPIRCSLCDYQTRYKSKLRMHIMKRHGGEDDPQQLKNQLLESSGGYNCEFCSFETTQLKYLKQHVLGVHNPEKSFRCDICDYATAFKNNLEKHMQKHSSEKPYKCELCDFESKHKEYIKKHVSLCHNEEECEVCGYKTRLKNDLITHLELEHNVCQTCENCETSFQPKVLSDLNFKA